jgi:hypothetical protein
MGSNTSRWLLAVCLTALSLSTVTRAEPADK